MSTASLRSSDSLREISPCDRSETAAQLGPPKLIKCRHRTSEASISPFTLDGAVDALAQMVLDPTDKKARVRKREAPESFEHHVTVKSSKDV